MTELVPYTPNLPSGRGGQTPGFLALAGRVATLAASAARLAEGLWNLRRQMERDADHADLLAELCTQAEVEPRYTALIREGATALRDVAKAATDVARTAADMSAAADDLNTEHRAEYGGVYETARLGPRQAKPGFYRIR
ncbi:conjugal transfer protein TraB [Streptomyces sp. NPDC091201]|uniref:conjugal transfer protein TraB n=1 Tax=Streptomyces sp. NPDC091201 TaxID=3155190 RepID=UPI003442EB0B